MNSTPSKKSPKESKENSNGRTKKPEELEHVDRAKLQQELYDLLTTLLEEFSAEHDDELTITDAVGALELVKLDIASRRFPPIPETLDDLL